MVALMRKYYTTFKIKHPVHATLAGNQFYDTIQPLFHIIKESSRRNWPGE